MKKEYIKPELKEEKVELEDIIATSGSYDPNRFLDTSGQKNWYN